MQKHIPVLLEEMERRAIQASTTTHSFLSFGYATAEVFGLVTFGRLRVLPDIRLL